MSTKKSPVTEIAAADPSLALKHFEDVLAFETDCHDVHQSLLSGIQDFVLLDVRAPDMYQRGHVPGAISLPHRKIIESVVARYPTDTLFVTYCAGPHCNGAQRGAIRLSRLGRRVKIMPGGITGWLDEGFSLKTELESSNE